MRAPPRGSWGCCPGPEEPRRWGSHASAPPPKRSGSAFSLLVADFCILFRFKKESSGQKRHENYGSQDEKCVFPKSVNLIFLYECAMLKKLLVRDDAEA